MTYEGSIFTLTGVEAVPATEYVAWVAIAEDGKDYSEADLLVCEFSTLNLVAGSSVKVVAGEQTATALDVVVPLTAEGAETIYYAVLTKAGANSYKDDAAKAALDGKDIEQALGDDYKMLLTKTGENVKIRRSERFVLEGAGCLSGYIHMGGKIGVLVELSCEKTGEKLDDAAHMICLHIAANSPRYTKPEEVPQAEIDAELEIKLNALKEQKGKLPPEQALVGIKKGMAAKYCTQVCLLKQDYVANADQTVEQYLAEVGKELGAEVSIKRFCRMQLGA
jgi:translation elongation factor Ts